MINRIIQFSIQNKFAIGLFTIALILYGSYSLTKLPIDAVPDITNNQVQIITLSPTLATQEVEQFVTYPIEQAMASLPDMVEMRSISRFGLSVVTVVFEDKVDIYFARQLVDQRLQEAKDEIPEGAGEPELGPVSTGLGEIYQYVIRPLEGYEEKYSSSDLRTMQDWIVARQLIGTPGVAEVNSFGGMLKQYEVAVDPLRLKSMNVTIPEVFKALELNNENTGGAYIEKQPNAYFIRGVGLVRSMDDIGKIVVKMNENGIPVLIRDVATPQFGSAVRYGSMTRNGEGEVVGGMVMMLKGANSAQVVSAVKEKIPVIQESLPEGVVIEAFLDRTSLVKRAIGTVEKNLLEGALIVIFILVLFLGNLRAGLIVASVIPLSMLFAIIMMNLFGVTGNLMSLGAIDFGLIVDGAVIIVEAVLHRITMHRHEQDVPAKLSQEQMDNQVYTASSRMMNSATFGQVIILIVYIPILTLIGIEGKMFKPMAMVVSFAIIGALILSLTYIPMMSALLLPKKTTHKRNISDRMMDMFQRWYRPFIEFAIKRRLTVIFIGVALFIGSVFLFTRMGGEFIPILEEGDFAFHSILPEGSSLSQSIENNAEVEKILMRFPEVKEVIGKSGAAEIPTDPMPPNATDLMIILKEKSEWTTADNREDLQDTMMRALSVIPGVFFEATQPIQMRFNELMTGVRQDVAVKIFGENIDSLAVYAQKVATVIKTVEGATEPQAERTTGLPQITIEYDRSRVAQYGLNISELNRIVRTAFAGEITGQVYENERRFDLVVRLANQNRKEIEDVRNLYVPLPNGGQIPLQQVATIDYVTGPSQISREDAKRRIVIGFNVRDRDVQSVVEELQAKLATEVKLPAGYYFTYGGTFKNLEEATKRLTIAVPVALLLIFVLLFFTFHSFKQALLIYTAIPMSAIGGVVALYARGMPFSISAGIGFIALFGVAVLNGIVLISTFNQLEKEGISDIVERVRKGTRIRLRPVLMTATVASLGFLPMAISGSAGAEVQRPLATVVIGGLITATALTLIVLPALYILFSGKSKKMKPIIITSSIILLLSLSQNVQSQTIEPLSIDLSKALDMAFDHNKYLQSQQLLVQSNQKLQNSVFELPKTEIIFQYGQLNSITNDNSFEVTQNIPFPSVYSASNKLYKAQIESSELNLKATKNEIAYRVHLTYDQIVYLQGVKLQLSLLDSFYVEFGRAARLRYETGETNLLEKTSAEVTLGEFTQLKLRNDAALASAFSELKTFIGFDGELLIDESELHPVEISPKSDSAILANPSLKNLYQQAIVAESNKRLVRAQVLPEFSIGYFNQSIIGTQSVDGNDVYFDAADRFTGISAGINIPLTFFNSASKVKSFELQSQSLQLQADYGKVQLQSQLQQTMQQYSINQSVVSYYQQQANPNADLINTTAIQGYLSGNIGYVEYLQALQTVSDIRLGYLEALLRLNQSVITINYLTGKY